MIDQKKLELIRSLLRSLPPEEAQSEISIEGQSTLLHKGNYYGGVYTGANGQRKLMYSDLLINTLSLEKLEKLIKTQAGIL